MTPPRILTAIQIGLTALDKEHAAMRMLWRKFSASVRADRKSRKIKLKVFAGRLGISPTLLGYLEKNRRPWTVARAELAVKLLTRREQWPD